MPRRLLITSALPYVNGHIHLGHLVEYLQTDMWVRFQRLQGNEVAYICADDTHGTATMIRARQEGRPESAIIAEMGAAHLKDFTDFGIRFDHYGSTDSPANRALVYEFWAALRAADAVVEKDVEQLYDPQAGSFLADRFVKGTCPNCKTPGQYGDSCEVCGTTYGAQELIDPVSTLSGARPELRSARHWFVRLEPYRAFLSQWTSGGLAPGGGPASGAGAGRQPGAGRDRALAGQHVSRRAPARLGREPPRALFRLRDPRRARQLFLRLARRPARLHRQHPGLVRGERR
jgi:methionyl-tRNA synthetase